MSATPVEVRRSYTDDALLAGFRQSQHSALLDEFSPERTARGLRIGPVEVREGQDPQKPVIIDARTKRMLDGSGKYPARKEQTADAGGLRPSTTYRENAEYREQFERLIPAGGDVDERGSLAWWFDQAWAAAEGSPQLVDCPHPHEHDNKTSGPVRHVIGFKKDGAIIFKMIELAVGKAAQTVNIRSQEEKLVRILEQRTVDVHLHGIEWGDVDARRAVIEAVGYQVEPGADPLSVRGGETALGGAAGPTGPGTPLVGAKLLS